MTFISNKKSGILYSQTKFKYFFVSRTEAQIFDSLKSTILFLFNTLRNFKFVFPFWFTCSPKCFFYHWYPFCWGCRVSFAHRRATIPIIRLSVHTKHLRTTRSAPGRIQWVTDRILRRMHTFPHLSLLTIRLYCICGWLCFGVDTPHTW